MELRANDLVCISSQKAVHALLSRRLLEQLLHQVNVVLHIGRQLPQVSSQ